MFYVLIIGLLLQGCGVGMMMAGSGASKAGTAKVQDAYTNYVLGMERVNLDREKAGLKPRPILSKQQWLGSQDDKESDKSDYNKWDAWQ